MEESIKETNEIKAAAKQKTAAKKRRERRQRKKTTKKKRWGKTTAKRRKAHAKDATLVIVESPAKAHTIGKFLGSEYYVTASQGHVRDFPKKQLGVDVENGFTPKYTQMTGKSAIYRKSKRRQRRPKSVAGH